LLGLIVFSGSSFLSIQSLKRLGAIRTTIIFPISSIFGLIFAVVLLHETITFYQICSVGIIVLGIDILTSKNSVIKEGMMLEQY
jgi:drug/metabolite transporter (DMT)-like permease